LLGMDVYITSDFQPGSPVKRSVSGTVVRIEDLGNGEFCIAIHIHSGK
jgi:hypothetical protein